MIEFNVEVRENILPNVEARIKSGLLAAGTAWRSTMAKYPPAKSDSTYTRTGGLRNKTTFVLKGLAVEFVSSIVARFLLFGTGIYGAKRQPITPKRGRFLIWRASRGSGGLIFARSVKGTIWQGKREEAVSAIKDAFIQGMQRK